MEVRLLLEKTPESSKPKIELDHNIYLENELIPIICMKIPNEILLSDKNDYCMNCFAESITPIKEAGEKIYACGTCGKKEKRRISTSDSIRWWLDEERNFWHESVGIFVFNNEAKILFFELTKFPFGFTIPAGHRDTIEESVETARRELLEETGLKGDNFELLCEENFLDDSCSRGADAHKWQAFLCHSNSTEALLEASEGKNAVWLTIEEALQKQLTNPVKHIITKYKDSLLRESRKA